MNNVRSRSRCGLLHECDDEFIDLGTLRGNLGDQNDALDPTVDLTKYRSVVIWCDRFDAAFGAAPLPE